MSYAELVDWIGASLPILSPIHHARGCPEGACPLWDLRRGRGSASPSPRRRSSSQIRTRYAHPTEA